MGGSEPGDGQFGHGQRHHHSGHRGGPGGPGAFGRPPDETPDGLRPGRGHGQRGPRGDLQCPHRGGHIGVGRSPPQRHPAQAGYDHGCHHVRRPAGQGDRRRHQKVELLLDGQRPEVLQRRRRHLEDCRIAARVGGGPPVEHVQHRGQRVEPDLAEGGVGEHGGERDGGRDGKQAGRHEPPHPPGHEPPQAQAAGGGHLGVDQAEDQVSRQREEEAHAEPSASHHVGPQVERHHPDHGYAPQPVEPGDSAGGPVGLGDPVTLGDGHGFSVGAALTT